MVPIDARVMSLRLRGTIDGKMEYASMPTAMLHWMRSRVLLEMAKTLTTKAEMARMLLMIVERDSKGRVVTVLLGRAEEYSPNIATPAERTKPMSRTGHGVGTLSPSKARLAVVRLDW